MASFSTTTVTITIIICQTLCLLSSSPAVWGVGREADPKPTPWPHQFHALLWANFSGSLSTIDLWYDWPNGRNLNLVRDQLSDRPLHDVEWNNGTSYFYTLDPSPANQQCRSVHLEVGILRPDWLDGGNYLGQRHVDGFLCNVWEKAEFIWYYEDVVSKSPVHWVFYTGRSIHVMTFEVGAVLEDEKWQAPGYCFENKDSEVDMKSDFATSALDIGFHRNLMRGVLRGSVEL